MSKKMISKLPIYKQEKPYSCAVACLRMVLSVYGIKISEEELREKCKTTEIGTSAEDMVFCATEFGLEAEIVYLTLPELKKILSDPIYPIVFINLFPINNIISTHAVIIVRIKNGEVEIIDPLEGEQTLDLTKFAESWRICRGIAILIHGSE